MSAESKKCETSLQLIYFNFTFIKTLYDILKIGAQFCPPVHAIVSKIIHPYLKEVRQFYLENGRRLDAVEKREKKCESKREEKAIISELHEIDDSLTPQVALSCKKRLEVMSLVKSLLNAAESIDLKYPLYQNFFLSLITPRHLSLKGRLKIFEQQSDKLISEIKKDGKSYSFSVKALAFEHAAFKEKVQNFFHSRLATCQWSTTLTSAINSQHFGPQFQKLLSQRKRILFLEQWLTKLEKDGANIIRSHSQGSISFCLLAKQLLANIKSQLYIEFYRDIGKQDSEIIADLLWMVTTRSVPDSIAFLQQRESSLILEVINQERKFCSYSHRSAVIITGLRCLFENYYYKFSDNAVNFIEQLTTDRGVLHRVPFINVKLSPVYRMLSVASCIPILARMDYKYTGTFGPSFALCRTITNLFSAELEMIIKAAAKIGIEDETVMQHFSKLQWLLSFGVYLGLSSLVFGSGASSLGVLAFTYFVATSCSTLCGNFLDYLKNRAVSRVFDKHDEKSTHQLKQAQDLFEIVLKPPLQHIAYCVGSKYLAPAVSEMIVRKLTTSEQLFSDDKLCQRFKADCISAALKKFGFLASDQLSVSKIHSRFREFSSKAHQQDGISSLELAEIAKNLGNAKDILLKEFAP